MMWLLTLWGGVKRLLGLAVAYPWQAALIIALAACGYFYMGKQSALATVAKRDATIAAMIKASKEATAAALANAERVKREYKEISDEAKQDYAGKLADNRAAIERWKLQNGRSATGQSNSTPATDIPTGVTGTEALPLVPRGFVILPESDLDKTADIQATLAALQEAARKVQAVLTVPATSGEVQE